MSVYQEGSHSELLVPPRRQPPRSQTESSLSAGSDDDSDHGSYLTENSQTPIMGSPSRETPARFQNISSYDTEDVDPRYRRERGGETAVFLPPNEDGYDDVKDFPRAVAAGRSARFTRRTMIIAGLALIAVIG
ncbi:hypothetical protein HDU93_008624, partial [Gonapodya sp. JEL0774]